MLLNPGVLGLCFRLSPFSRKDAPSGEAGICHRFFWGLGRNFDAFNPMALHLKLPLNHKKEPRNTRDASIAGVWSAPALLLPIPALFLAVALEATVSPNSLSLLPTLILSLNKSLRIRNTSPKITENDTSQSDSSPQGPCTTLSLPVHFSTGSLQQPCARNRVRPRSSRNRVQAPAEALCSVTSDYDPGERKEPIIPT